MVLQRTPVIRYLAQLEYSLVPRTQHLWRAAVTAFTVGAYNTVTAASGDLIFNEGQDDATVLVGEELQLVVEVEGSKLLRPKTWVVEGDLPAGVTYDIRQNLGIVVISGAPTEAGIFPIVVKAWELANMMGDPGTPLEFDIVVESPGPVFTSQPEDQTVPWGGTLNLSAIVENPEGTTFQWQRFLSGETEYNDIEGAIDSVLSITNLSSSDEGMYRVVATNGEGSTFSTDTLITVSSTLFQIYVENHFEDPFSAVADFYSDPDFDSLVNGAEFAFGLDPMVAESRSIPLISREEIDGVQYVVFSFPPLATLDSQAVSLERNTTLRNEDWTTVANGENGIISENQSENFVVKIPASSEGFQRLRFTPN